MKPDPRNNKYEDPQSVNLVAVTSGVFASSKYRDDGHGFYKYVIGAWVSAANLYPTAINEMHEKRVRELYVAYCSYRALRDLYPAAPTDKILMTIATDTIPRSLELMYETSKDFEANLERWKAPGSLTDTDIKINEWIDVLNLKKQPLMELKCSILREQERLASRGYVKAGNSYRLDDLENLDREIYSIIFQVND